MLLFGGLSMVVCSPAEKVPGAFLKQTVEKWIGEICTMGTSPDTAVPST